MSPLWRNQTLVALSPSAATIRRRPRGWRKAASIECITLAPDAPNWEERLLPIKQALSGVGSQDIEVVVSNHLAHYAVLPPAGALNADAERLALAQRVFTQHYGALADDWVLLPSPSNRHEPSLACGVDAQLIAALRSTLQSVGRLRSIRPLLMDTFNAICRRLDSTQETLVMVERGRITIALLKGKQWQTVLSRSVSPEDRSVLTHLLQEQACLREERLGGSLWLHDPQTCVTPPHGEAWSLKPVSDERHSCVDLAIWENA